MTDEISSIQFLGNSMPLAENLLSLLECKNKLLTSYTAGDILEEHKSRVIILNSLIDSELDILLIEQGRLHKEITAEAAKEELKENNVTPIRGDKTK